MWLILDDKLINCKKIVEGLKLLRNRKWGRLLALSLVLILVMAALVGCAADDKADVAPTERQSPIWQGELLQFRLRSTKY